MTISIKTAEDVQGMRVAGRLASEVLDMLGPLVKPGITTGEIDRIAHDYMVNVQGGTPTRLRCAPRSMNRSATASRTSAC
jgi:methionyl aminopeptidase